MLLCYFVVLPFFFVNTSEYSRLYWVTMPLLCTCWFYVFVGMLVYHFALCVAVVSVSVGEEA
jgi:hypothetical protein